MRALRQIADADWNKCFISFGQQMIKYFSKDLHVIGNQLQSNVSTIPVLYFTMLSLITYRRLSFRVWLLVLCLFSHS